MTDGLHTAARGALVVFVDDTEVNWLRTLRPGFRHCFAALEAERGWLICDPLKGEIALSFLQVDEDFDLAAFYVGQGHSVLTGWAMPKPVRRWHLPEPLTCVAIVKKLLRVDAPCVLTPWQLFRHLSKIEQGVPRHRVDSTAYPQANVFRASGFQLDKHIN